MSINWWTLGLQAINVLILVWLLSRVFWRPVSKAIATRQLTASTLLNDAKAAKEKADAELSKVTKARAGLAAERQEMLATAAKERDAASKAALSEAAAKVDKQMKAARAANKKEAEVAKAKTTSDAALLAIDISRKLLARLNANETQAAFLQLLVKNIKEMAAKDRQALLETKGGITLVSAKELSKTARIKVTQSIKDALDGTPEIDFQTDVNLIAGFELRTPHFVLSNSWQADLAAILKDIKDAA